MPDSDDALDGLGSFIRMTGFTIPSRARFVGETMVTASLSSLTFGMLFGNIGSIIPSVGPLAPFLFGSWMGYSIGLLAQWRNSRQLAVTYAKKYPSLMLYAIKNQEWGPAAETLPRDGDSVEKWIVQGGLARTTISILAAQSLKTCVYTIEERGRDKEAEKYYND